MADNIYLRLTKLFNAGKVRAILSSGQAVVLHRLAMMSKDGDWILRSDAESLEYVLRVLSDFGAVYRFGAPLDLRWLANGWSSHLEFFLDGMRVRTDFVVTPPRISAAELERMWREQEGAALPFVGLRDLVELKKTNREKDYPVIGELARRLTSARDKLLCSRSARDLITLAREHPAALADCIALRPILAHTQEGEEPLAAALDAERRQLIRANEVRLQRYMHAAQGWLNAWPQIQNSLVDVPLLESHARVVIAAESKLPFSPQEADAKPSK